MLHHTDCGFCGRLIDGVSCPPSGLPGICRSCWDAMLLEFAKALIPTPSWEIRCECSKGHRYYIPVPEELESRLLFASIAPDGCEGEWVQIFLAQPGDPQRRLSQDN